MARVILGATISLDGFINDKNGDVGRLYTDLMAVKDSEIMQESIRNTGAVVMGKHTFEMGDPDSYAGNYEYRVPIFVITHHPPAKMPKQDDKLTFTFVTDGVASAIAQAKKAAGSRDVTIIGSASIPQQILRAGLADELDVLIAPVLFGQGLRFFEHLEDLAINLEPYQTRTENGLVEIKYRILQDT